jgi:two-component system, chemotaxis family, chemotaxis protein CheY
MVLTSPFAIADNIFEHRRRDSRQGRQTEGAVSMARILICDDSAVMRGLLTHISRKAGHEVVGKASSARESVELFRDLAPDIVTMDIAMPGPSGLCALEEILEIDLTAKVVIVTALGTAAKRQEASELGGAGFIEKPFQPEAVACELGRVLGQSIAREDPT